MNLVFLLAASANILWIAFHSSIYQFKITNLIELHMGKLILNHLIGYNCPEFHNGSSKGNSKHFLQPVMVVKTQS